jgi:two-component system invasion response regulator UvrY
LASKYKIIVVDDHAIVRHGVRLLLSSQPDFEVVGESHNGKELLDFCRSLTPDLILLDLSLDDRNGLDLIKKVTKNYPDVRILIFSALEESNYAVRALKSGAWGFVSKEQAATDLVNAIRVVLQGQKYISPTTSQFLANWLVDAEQSPPHISLSEREFQTFQSIAAGLKTAEIAEKMNISVKTVSMYRQRALVKIGLRNNSELIAYAIKNNLTLDSSPPAELG